MSASDTEIERKFLVARMPDLARAHSVRIRQGYLSHPDDLVEVRLRQKGDVHVLTVKSGTGIVREEREAAIDPAQFETFWPATEGRRIEKTRWTGTLADGHTFELDIFSGVHAPLRVVEVEFDSIGMADSFAPPDWFGGEVTGERAYSNKVMCVEGIPASWSS